MTELGDQIHMSTSECELMECVIAFPETDTPELKIRRKIYQQLNHINLIQSVINKNTIICMILSWFTKMISDRKNSPEPMTIFLDFYTKTGSMSDAQLIGREFSKYLISPNYTISSLFEKLSLGMLEYVFMQVHRCTMVIEEGKLNLLATEINNDVWVKRLNIK